MAIFLSNKNNGFTLVEALVAITILTLALGGPMALATRSIKDSLASRNKVTAFYLAQEALEYVRNIRDSNFLTNVYQSSQPVSLYIPWLNGLDDCDINFDGDGCYIDVVSNNVYDCGSCPDGAFLYLTSSNNYTHNSGDTKTIFKRVVEIDESLNGGNEAKVVVKVEWTDYGNRIVTLTQNMFNLAPAP